MAIYRTGIDVAEAAVVITNYYTIITDACLVWKAVHTDTQ